jgi:hypothetical protein
VLLTVVSAADGAAEGIYGAGPYRHGERWLGYRFQGQIDGDVLKFSHDDARQEYHLRPDGRLDVRWTKANGSGAISGVLHRLSGDGS